MLMEILCGPRCCLEGVVGLQPTFYYYHAEYDSIAIYAACTRTKNIGRGCEELEAERQENEEMVGAKTNQRLHV